jgi:hypothetical protein
MSRRKEEKMKLSLVTIGTAGALALAAAPSASADVGLTGGSTTLKLKRSTAQALDGLGVSVAPTGRARVAGGGVRFPITGGAIDPATAAGTIRHAGGLRLSAGGTRVTLASPRVAVGRQINLSARIGGGRLHVAKLVGRARVSRSGFNTNVRGLRAELTQKAARALNRAFGVTAFAKGLELGSVVVRSRTDETELARSGGTGLELDPNALQALASQGITPGVIEPATLSGATATFPITGGRADLDLGAGVVRHAGGISLTKGSTVVRLTAFDIRLGSTPQLFASLNGGAQKAAILDLDLSGAATSVDGRSITVDNVVARLTQGAADALNQAFGTSAFSGGLVIGRATVRANGR